MRGDLSLLNGPFAAYLLLFLSSFEGFLCAVVSFKEGHTTVCSQSVHFNSVNFLISLLVQNTIPKYLVNL